ncbi:GNAT family N-acetyltransferase [Halobacillus salinus]|uniref:N-acetyltransferase n=1 Tax=Halobacillus salinus TaxID=192814 RepID=A0A4Z0H215_9BACI|nr:GNAT family N-acetyltransferase [Halobacillus salinus]TGB04433.1 N-acetyltransferase [Halobacillus salinus]
MEFPELHTERLCLTRIKSQHADAFYDIMSRDEVTYYYGMESLTDRSQAEEIIRSFQEGFESQQAIRWGLIEKESKAFIGTIGLNRLQLLGKKAEIGYEVHPDYWRRGYAREAVNEVLHYSMENLDLYRVGAVTFVENDSSRTLLKSIGFKEEGILRGYLYQRKQSHDAVVFSIIQPEWNGGAT